MKFELKTESENYSRSIFYIFKTIFFVSLIILFCDITLKLGIIAKDYQINYNCRLLSIERASSNFKKLSRLSNLKSKQKIWEFCREFLNSI